MATFEDLCEPELQRLHAFWLYMTHSRAALTQQLIDGDVPDETFLQRVERAAGFTSADGRRAFREEMQMIWDQHHRLGLIFGPPACQQLQLALRTLIPDIVS